MNTSHSELEKSLLKNSKNVRMNEVTKDSQNAYSVILQEKSRQIFIFVLKDTFTKNVRSDDTVLLIIFTSTSL